MFCAATVSPFSLPARSVQMAAKFSSDAATISAARAVEVVATISASGKLAKKFS